jgi:EamA domain-containing membrane protein RarD
VKQVVVSMSSYQSISLFLSNSLSLYVVIRVSLQTQHDHNLPLDCLVLQILAGLFNHENPGLPSKNAQRPQRARERD